MAHKIPPLHIALANSSQQSQSPGPMLYYDPMTTSTTTSVHSQDSGNTSPTSPVFSQRSHLRHTSSSSSLASATSPFEPSDPPSSAIKESLPDLVEEPHEREDDFDVTRENFSNLSPCLCNELSCPHRKGPTNCVPFPAFNAFDNYELADSVISDQDLSSSQQWPKRRRSGDSSPSPISSRLVERLPSISKRWKDRRVGLTISTSGSRSVPTSRAASRASSLNGSARPVVEYREQQAPLTPAKSEPDHDFDLLEEPSPLSIDIEKASKDPIDRKALASTPLLPPTMLDLAAARDDSVQSPLQSPSVAEPNRTFSLCNTPAGSPHLFSMPTPPLSSRPSFSSFHRARAASSQQVSSADVGFLELGEINDEWSMKLGHANFMIEPEPYMPAICDLRTCQHLLDDWHQARCNYQKHQVRTGEHYGATSKTYKLTEKKWAEIDACWRANYDLAVVTAAHNGYVVESSTPVEPAPLAKLPSLHDPKSEGKFPKLGDEDIVGPMVQIASQVQPKQSRKASFLKFLGEIKFPGSVLGNKPSSFSPTR